VWTDIAAAGARLTARIASGDFKATLSKKLDNALEKWKRGNTNAAANQLRVIIAEIDAQRGKAVTDAAADELTDIAAMMAFAINNGTLPAGVSTE